MSASMEAKLSIFLAMAALVWFPAPYWVLVAAGFIAISVIDYVALKRRPTKSEVT